MKRIRSYVLDGLLMVDLAEEVTFLLLLSLS